MPEGDTIYRTATVLRRALGDATLTAFETSVPDVAEGARRTPLVGRRIHAILPHGKHLLLVLRDDAQPLEEIRVPPTLPLELIATDRVLHTHLRMIGSWHIYRPGEPWQKPARLAKVTLRTKDFVAPCFNAPVVELLTARQTARTPALVELGPDATTESFDADEARARMRRRPDIPIGVALLNQRLMAGVGNIFKSEVLFIRRVSPFATVGDLSDETLDGLIAESHRLLHMNRDRGNRRTMSSLNERERLWVYGRSGQSCRVCGATIHMRRQGIDGRSTYYCTRCQGGEVVRDPRRDDAED
jgi:endonuclease-8